VRPTGVDQPRLMAPGHAGIGSLVLCGSWIRGPLLLVTLLLLSYTLAQP